MKNIAIFCVNYNSYGEFYKFAKSVEMAAQTAVNMVRVSLFVADNTVEDKQEITYSSKLFDTKVFHFDNVGYFGAINKMMTLTEIESFDYVCISNVDVRLSNDMLLTLANFNNTGNIGWIAPSIYSELEQRDRNPVATNRYSLKSLKLRKLMFRYTWLHKLQYHTIYKRKKLQKIQTKRTIYSGHGSFIILTSEYFKHCGIINYPIFLYGEELYLAEMCRNNGLAVYYFPNIRIIDNEHYSTGQMSSKFKDKCNLNAITYIINTFYK